MENNYIEFCKYIIPIITGCAGFIRTTGYVAHVPGFIIMMSDDETFINIVKIPIIFNIVLSAKINDLLKIKEEQDMLNVVQNTYFLGNNIKYASMINYLGIYTNIDNLTDCIYSEDNCYNIEFFDNASKMTSIEYINVSNQYQNFMIPASKSITNLNKADKVGLKIYNYINNPCDNRIKTIRYSMYKNKFKLISDIFANIIVV